MELLLTYAPLLTAFAIIALAIYLFATEKLPLELSGIIIILALMLHAKGFSLLPATRQAVPEVKTLLSGFANPMLIAILCLMVCGQALVSTGALQRLASIIIRASGDRGWLALLACLLTVPLLSAFLNNTPVIVMFIPILLTLAKRYHFQAKQWLMPLSFLGILGGMTTLVGSGTNLLVSGALLEASQPDYKLSFFSFSLPGLCLLAAGLLYVLLVVPRMLRKSGQQDEEEVERVFITQLTIPEQSSLIGQTVCGDSLADIKGMRIRVIQRGEEAYLPPYDNEVAFAAGDRLVIATTRASLSELLTLHPAMLLHTFPEMQDEDASNKGKTIPIKGLTFAEVVIPPVSRLVGNTLQQIGFRFRYHCVTVGMLRQHKMVRARMTDIPLQAGDVLLVMGTQEDVMALRTNHDVMLMEWATERMASSKYANRAIAIFTAIVGLTALDILPIYLSSVLGAALCVLCGCLNVHQALKTLDSHIIFLVAAAIAMSSTLESTGGANLIASSLITLLKGADAVWVMSAFYGIIALFTNILSNKAAALLFTPIALEIARQLHTPPEMFVFAVIFAGNTAFATPIGYQTNLLIMTPGQYRFRDYLVTGLPLSLICWITYTLYSWITYGQR